MKSKAKYARAQTHRKKTSTEKYFPIFTVDTVAFN